MNSAQHAPPSGLAELQAAYLHAMQLGSGRAADAVLQNALDSKMAAGDIYLDLFQPTSSAIGKLWQRNAMSVAQEHLATAIIERQMGELHPLFKPVRSRTQTLVIGCVHKEMHRVGVRMAADFFEQDGWNVYNLGASVPTEQFVWMAREMKADLIGLGSQLIYTLPAIGEFVRELDRRGMGGIPVIAGGLPFVQQPDLYKSLGVHFAGADARAAVAHADELFGGAPGAATHQGGEHD